MACCCCSRSRARARPLTSRDAGRSPGHQPESQKAPPLDQASSASFACTADAGVQQHVVSVSRLIISDEMSRDDVCKAIREKVLKKVAPQATPPLSCVWPLGHVRSAACPSFSASSRSTFRWSCPSTRLTSTKPKTCSSATGDPRRSSRMYMLSCAQALSYLASWLTLSLSLASFHFAYDGDEIRLEVGADHSGGSGKENLEGNPPLPGESEHLFRTPEGKLKSEIQSSTQLTLRRFACLSCACLCVGRVRAPPNYRAAC